MVAIYIHFTIVYTQIPSLALFHFQVSVVFSAHLVLLGNASTSVLRSLILLLPLFLLREFVPLLSPLPPYYALNTIISHSTLQWCGLTWSAVWSLGHYSTKRIGNYW